MAADLVGYMDAVGAPAVLRSHVQSVSDVEQFNHDDLKAAIEEAQELTRDLTHKAGERESAMELRREILSQVPPELLSDADPLPIGDGPDLDSDALVELRRSVQDLLSTLKKDESTLWSATSNICGECCRESLSRIEEVLLSAVTQAEQEFQRARQTHQEACKRAAESELNELMATIAREEAERRAIQQSIVDHEAGIRQVRFSLPHLTDTDHDPCSSRWLFLFQA